MSDLYFKYGSYSHDPGECEVFIHRNEFRGPRGEVIGMQDTWDVVGRIHANDTAGVLAKIRNMEAAYSVNNKDAGFIGTNHAMINSNTINGIKVIKFPSYARPLPGEFSTYRNYELTLQCEYPYVTGGVTLANWEETLHFVGTGGPSWGYLECLNGPPQMQIFKERTVCRVTQSGSATAIGGYPLMFVPQPIWPQYEHQDHREISPIAHGDAFDQKSVHWTYHFSMTYPINRTPTPPGRR
jgi:hypothetical protein